MGKKHHYPVGIFSFILFSFFKRKKSSMNMIIIPVWLLFHQADFAATWENKICAKQSNSVTFLIRWDRRWIEIKVGKKEEFAIFSSRISWLLILVTAYCLQYFSNWTFIIQNLWEKAWQQILFHVLRHIITNQSISVAR